MKHEEKKKDIAAVHARYRNSTNGLCLGRILLRLVDRQGGWSSILLLVGLFAKKAPVPTTCAGRFSSSRRSKIKKSSGKVRCSGRSLLLYPQVCSPEARVSGDST